MFPANDNVTTSEEPPIQPLPSQGTALLFDYFPRAPRTLDNSTHFNLDLTGVGGVKPYLGVGAISMDNVRESLDLVEDNDEDEYDNGDSDFLS